MDIDSRFSLLTFSNPPPATTSLPVGGGDEVQWSAMLKPYYSSNISNSRGLDIMSPTRPHTEGVVIVCVTMPTPDPKTLDLCQDDTPSVTVHPLYASWLVRRPCRTGTTRQGRSFGTPEVG